MCKENVPWPKKVYKTIAVITPYNPADITAVYLKCSYLPEEYLFCAHLKNNQKKRK